MTATGNEAVSLEQLKDYAANQSAGSGDSACQVFVVTGGTSSRTVEMNGWRVQIPAGTGGTYVFLASETFIVLHTMYFTAKPTVGNIAIYHNSAKNLRSSATAYSSSPGTRTYGWPISGAPTRYTENSNVTSDILEVMTANKNRVIINIVEANNMDGYQLNVNFKVNFCVWIE